MRFLAAIVLMFSSVANCLETVTLNTVNNVVIRGPITQDSTAVTQLALAKAVVVRGSAEYPIYLVLDTPGGDVVAGQQLIEFAKTIKNLKTITLFAASMGAVLIESLPGERLIAPNGILMFHRAKGGFEGQFETGEVESELGLWKSIIRRMETIVSSRMSLSLDAYKANIVNEWWMTSDQAVNAKAADSEKSILCTPELIFKTTSLDINTMFGSFHLDFSTCPTIRAPLRLEGNKEEYSKYLKANKLSL